MKINHIEKGHKVKFDNIEDVLQTFFSIARALYDIGVADEEDTSNGIVTTTATVPEKGTIRIRIDYPEEAETMEGSANNELL